MPNIEDFLLYDKDTSQLVIAYSDGADPNCAIVAPDARVPKSFQYITYPKGNFRFTGDTTRGVGDMNVQELKIGGGTWTQGFLVEHPLESDPFDRQILNRDGVVKGISETDLTEKGIEVKNSLDQEWASKVIALATAITNKTTPTKKWNESGATPGANLRAAGIQFFKNCGRKPTHLLIPWIVFQHMGGACRAEFGISKDISDRAVVERIVLQNLGIPASNLLIPDQGVYNSTSTEYEIEWGENVMLFYSKPSPTKKDVCFMKTFRPSDKPPYWQYAPYETSKKTGIQTQGVMEYFVKVTCEAAGYLLYNTLA